MLQLLKLNKSAPSPFYSESNTNRTGRTCWHQNQAEVSEIPLFFLWDSPKTLLLWIHRLPGKFSSVTFLLGYEMTNSKPKSAFGVSAPKSMQ